MQIIDGYVGAPNIYADVIGEHNISMYGSGDYVLNVGECLGYELISNNEIRIKDGMFITQGRRGYIKKGTTEVCQIDNGAQTGKRNDLIVIEYAKDLSTQVESHTIRVLKGIPGAEASDPEITTGSMPDGAILHQMPLYRVKIEGLNVVAVEQMFEMGSVAAETVNPMEATEPGFAADALAVKKQFSEQNKNLSADDGLKFQFATDGEGNYGYLGADGSLVPFRSGEFSIKEHSGTSLNKEKTYILFMYHTGTPSCTGINCTVTTLATWTSYNSDKTIFLGAFKITNVKANASYSSSSRSIKCYEVSAE